MRRPETALGLTRPTWTIVGNLKAEATLSDAERQTRAKTDDWQPLEIAPAGADLELQVRGGEDIYALPFACRGAGEGWVNNEMNVPLRVEPLQWRAWPPHERIRERARSATWPRSVT